MSFVDISTLISSLRSIGTAVSMATTGMYLYQKKILTPEGSKCLAKISQQVTIPCLLFSKILFCNQDWSSNECPDVTATLKSTWILLLLPLWVVGCGILTGHLVTSITKAPNGIRRGVVVACAFPNSTGLPITLLTGKIDIVVDWYWC